MKKLLFILMFLNFSNLFSVDYILEFQANVKIIKEYNISKTENLEVMS